MRASRPTTCLITQRNTVCSPVYKYVSCAVAYVLHRVTGHRDANVCACAGAEQRLSAVRLSVRPCLSRPIPLAWREALDRTCAHALIHLCTLTHALITFAVTGYQCNATATILWHLLLLLLHTCIHIHMHTYTYTYNKWIHVLIVLFMPSAHDCTQS